MISNGQSISKVKLFVESFLVYGFGGIISKLIPLVMLPIVTRMMPSTDYFGISDLSNTIVQFGSSLAVMGMYDAMYRMFFEKEETEFKKNICSTSLVFTIITSIIVFAFMLLFRSTIARLFFGDRKYAYVVYLSAMATLVGATNSIISAPTRMQNKRKLYLITNTISPLISYAFAIPMLLSGHYIIALPMAAVISGIAMETIFYILNRTWFEVKKFDLGLLKQLLVIAVPLLPNFLVYWVFNSSDKIMITNLINVGASGVYSVGSKLGHVSQLIYLAFAGGWQYFAFSTMKEKNQVESNSKVFEYLGIISFFFSVFVFALSKTVFKLLFTDDYALGYIVAPYLFMAPLMQMLFQVACNQFIVIKRTWPNMFILTGGALINVLLNLLLIPRIGIEGAAIATLLGYLCSDIICCIVLCKMGLMVIPSRFLIVSGITCIYIILWRFITLNSVVMSLILATLSGLLMIYLYKSEVKTILRAVSNSLRKA